MSGDNDKTDKNRKPGSVKHDGRGNAVWQWAADTGRNALESTSALLRRLDLPGLKLEDDRPTLQGGSKDAEPPNKTSGYNPYGPTGASKSAAPKPPAKPVAKRVAPAAGNSAKEQRPSFLGKLFRKD